MVGFWRRRYESPSRTSSWAADWSRSIADWVSNGSAKHASEPLDGVAVRGDDRGCGAVAFGDELVDLGGDNARPRRSAAIRATKRRGRVDRRLTFLLGRGLITAAGYEHCC
jgi:hypothetical protein